MFPIFEQTINDCASEIIDCQQPDNDYDPNYRRERFGNNRKKTKGSVVKRKRKLAKKSQRKNRK